MSLGATWFGEEWSHDPTGGLLQIGDARPPEALREWVDWAMQGRADGQGRATADQRQRALPRRALNAAFFTTRDMTAEDAEREAPKTETLRRVQVLPRGTVLYAPVQIPQEHKTNFELLLRSCRHAGLTRNRGMGHVQLSLVDDNMPVPASRLPDLPGSGVHVVPLRLLLTAPCLLTQGTWEDNSLVSRSYLTGSTLRGAFARNLIACGVSEAERERLLTSGAVRFFNGYPEVEGKRSLPTPITWRRKKAADISDADSRARPWDAAVSLLNNKAREETEDQSQQTPIATPFWSSGTEPKPASVRRRSWTHQARQSSTGISDTVFTYEALEADQAFRAAVVVSGEDWPTVKQALLHQPLRLGRSGRAGYGGNLVLSCPDNKPLPTEEGAYGGELKQHWFVLKLTADAILRDPNTGQYDPSMLRELVAKRFDTLAIVHQAAIRTTTVQGYNRLWRTTLPAVPAVGMGSVVLLYAERKLSREEVRALQNEPLGERIAEGFGTFILSPVPAEGKLTLREVVATSKPLPQTNEPEELLQAQRRLYRTRLQILLADEAAKVTGGLPASALGETTRSLLGRLSASLRDPDWQTSWRTWLGGPPNGLRQEAKEKLRSTRLGQRHLLEWMEAAIQESWSPPLSANDAAAERTRYQMVSKGQAEALWDAVGKDDALRLYYVTLVLAHLQRKVKQLSEETTGGSDA
jgi:hypothetical protein